MPPGRGGQSFLFSAKTVALKVVLKIRAHADDSCARELFGLRALPAGLGPRLLAHATPAALLERAALQRRFDALADLDVSVGPVLLLEHLDGALNARGRPEQGRHRDPRDDGARFRLRGAGVSPVTGVHSRVTPALLTATAHALTTLHARRLRVGPPLAVPADPARLLALARDRAAALRATRALDARGLVHLERALASAARHVDACWRRGLHAGPRALCHGDLRWANLAWDGDARARLLDLEHAGLGDPSIDLAMFASRTPLSSHEELLLLDAYLRGAPRARARAFIERYFAQRPLVALAGALDGALELVLVARGERLCVRTADAQWRLRRDEVQAELAHVLYASVALVRESTARNSARARPRSRAIARIVEGPSTARTPARENGRAPRGVLVAVDGHAASGKSLIARDLAGALGVPWINTGAAYRYAALIALREDLVATRGSDVARLCRAVRTSELRLDHAGGLLVGSGNAQRRLSSCLGVLAVDAAVAEWAALPPVRDALAPVIAAAIADARARGGVVEGRDVGTVLLPLARHKLFVTASLDQRAAFVADKSGREQHRRGARALVHTRDRRDETRATAPLRRPAGARLLDTTGLTREAALARALALLRRDA